MTIVSNSDIETSQKCERMFYYSRILGLRPRNLPVALKRGSFGHKMMEAGFDAIIAGGAFEDAQAAATIEFEQLLASGDSDVADMMGVFRHVCAFFGYVFSDKCPWRPVATEEKGMWNITQANLHPSSPLKHAENEPNPADRIFGYTPDLIVEFTQGLYKGQYAVLDYKFLGQYMKEVALEMSQQIPKYIIYRNKTHPEIKLRRGAFIQLNTRAKPDDSGHKLFLIKWIEPSKERFRQIEEENELLVSKVADLYENTDRKYLRTVNKDVCNWCFFGQDICPMEFDGKDVTATIEKNYVPNDYGYNDIPLIGE